MLRQFTLLLSLLVAISPSLAAGDPWLLPFPNIAFDSRYAYFYSDDWVGQYAPGFGIMYTLPRDSANVPLPPVPAEVVATSKGNIQARVSELTLIRSNGDSSTFALPSPSADAVQYLNDLAQQRGVTPVSPREVIHPLLAGGDRVWFGLALSDDESGLSTGGLGWFELKSERFSRVYTPALAGYTPEWIGIANDTLHALFASAEAGNRQTKMLRLAVKTGALNEVNTAFRDVFGDYIEHAALWGDTLLITTDETVVIWKPGNFPAVWNTRMYASRTATPLFLVTFSGDPVQAQDTIRYQMLPPNKPAAVKTQVGAWMEIVAPEGIEGYVRDEDWRAHQKIWAERFWNCGDTLCFAFVRIPHDDSFIAGHFTHVPMTYIGKDANGIKIGFRAGWARQEQLLPVLMPR